MNYRMVCVFFVEVLYKVKKKLPAFLTFKKLFEGNCNKFGTKMEKN
jgi:hypothetical protein